MKPPMETPNTAKQKQRARLASDVDAFLNAGGTITTGDSRYAPLAKGPDQSDFVRAPSAAALLGFPEDAIRVSFRTGSLGGHPAPEFIKHRATSEPMFMREAVYRWLEKYGRSGSRGVPKSESDDGMLTLLEVTQATGLSRPTLYKYMKAGTFPQKVKGEDRRKYWRESEVNAYLEKKAAA